MKKILLSTAVAAVTFLGTATGAMADWKPNGPIKLMIAFAAGGGADTIARAVGDELQKTSWLGSATTAGNWWRWFEACRSYEGRAK